MWSIVNAIAILIGFFLLLRWAPQIFSFLSKLPMFMYMVVLDIVENIKSGNQFKQFGLRMYCGRQGSGKTIGIVEQLEEWYKKYPKLQIYTNFDYEHSTGILKDWNDLLTIRNGTDGVVFAIDEIQNEFSSNAWKDFPEGLLSEITQQRKQRVCILASSQVFTRVAKQLREQCFFVIECRTYLGRWTRLKCYEAEDYNTIVDNPSPEKKFKLPKKWTRSFLQYDELRNLYDTYAKVERLQRVGFAPKV